MRNIYLDDKKPRFSVSTSTFIVLVSLYFGFVLNIPVTTTFISLAGETGNGYFAYSSPLLLSAAFAIIFSFLTWPFLTKPIFVLLVSTSALASFGTLKYGVIFDYAMVENIFETNASEAFSYLSFSSVTYFVGLGLIPCLLIVFVHFRQDTPLSTRLLQRLLVFIGAAVIIAVIYQTSYKSYASVGRNNAYLNKVITPTHIYSTVEYISKTYFTEPLEYQFVGEDAVKRPATNGKPTLMVFVVGETARAMNIGYNGYARNTNPHTEGMGIISFKNVSSCGTSTAHSLPCMFSNLNRRGYDKARANAQDNALDIINRAGLPVLWKENDGGDKAVAKHLELHEFSHDDYPQLCADGACLDEIMLVDFDKEVVAIPEGQGKLFVFHIMGSHGPTYWKRFPEGHELFSPSCNQADIENCSDEEIVNVYDNTIAYTDFILAETIQRLQRYSKAYNVALMYLSDHGESLGENGLYLHGTPYSLAPKEQTQVPWFLWMGEGFEQAYQFDRDCIVTQAEQGSFSHDNLFHTLLDFTNIETEALKPSMSAVANCRR